MRRFEWLGSEDQPKTSALAAPADAIRARRIAASRHDFAVLFRTFDSNAVEGAMVSVIDCREDAVVQFPVDVGARDISFLGSDAITVAPERGGALRVYAASDGTPQQPVPLPIDSDDVVGGLQFDPSTSTLVAASRLGFLVPVFLDGDGGRQIGIPTSGPQLEADSFDTLSIRGDVVAVRETGAVALYTVDRSANRLLLKERMSVNDPGTVVLSADGGVQLIGPGRFQPGALVTAGAMSTPARLAADAGLVDIAVVETKDAHFLLGNWSNRETSRTDLDALVSSPSDAESRLVTAPRHSLADLETASLTLLRGLQQ